MVTVDIVKRSLQLVKFGVRILPHVRIFAQICRHCISVLLLSRALVLRYIDVQHISRSKLGGIDPGMGQRTRQAEASGQ